MLQQIQKKLGPGPTAMIWAGLFFSGMAALVKVLGTRLPIFQMTFFRAAISAMIILVAMKQQNISFRGNNQKILWIRAISGYVAMCLNFYALSKIELGNAAVLHQTTPFFVMLFSWFFLKERFHRLVPLLTLVGFMGVLLVLQPSTNGWQWGSLAALSGASLAGVAYVSIRHLHKTDSFWTMAFYFMTASAIFSLPPMLIQWVWPTPVEWLLLTGTGLLGTFGQLLMTYSYQHDRAAHLAPFAYSGVLFSFAWGAFFFSEVPHWLTWLGAIVTILSGIGILRLKKD